MIVLIMELMASIFIVVVSIWLFRTALADVESVIKKIIGCIMSIVFVVIGFVFCYDRIKEIKIFHNPAETIIQNGHTYRLADENDVDEEIEVNGHKYILADE